MKVDPKEIARNLPSVGTAYPLEDLYWAKNNRQERCFTKDLPYKITRIAPNHYVIVNNDGEEHIIVKSDWGQKFKIEPDEPETSERNMENTFHYRHFLMCNKMANAMMNVMPQNFAKLIVEEDMGRFMNSQMTFYFHQADRTLSDMIGNDEGFMWDELNIDEIADMTPEELEHDYNRYCSGNMIFKHTNEN